MAKDQLPAAGLLRRMAAAGYDLLLVAALLIFATALLVVPYQMIFAQPLPPAHPLFRAYLALVVLGFYVWFWSRGGQTAGMRAWRIKLVAADGRPPDAARALLRAGAMLLGLLPLGLGFFAMLWDPEGLAWHDRRSATRMLLVPKGGDGGAGG
jgi:uncharacterized RDD family membrane protein YckC